ncbi:MAG: pirin family protein [Gemmataceae bacterium]
MFTIRHAADRGHFHHGWLETYHTFSFGDYFDPAQRGFRSLRVMNDDRIAPGQGFGTHPHRDMEIITVVLAGELEHRDSLGSGAVLRPEDVQRISAGTGIEHSEWNPSPTESVHLYQIWLFPDQKGRPPRYDQAAFAPAGRANRWQTIASQDRREGSLSIYQDATVQRATLAPAATLRQGLAPGRCGWLQVMTGSVTLNGQLLHTGDGVAIQHENELQLQGGANAAELLWFDLRDAQ